MQLYSELGHGDGHNAGAAEAPAGGSRLWQVPLQPLRSRDDSSAIESGDLGRHSAGKQQVAVCHALTLFCPISHPGHGTVCRTPRRNMYIIDMAEKNTP